MREGVDAQDDAVRAQSQFIQMVAKIYFHEAEVDIAQLMPHFSHRARGVRYLAPVSYTHLDVYKRQFQHGVDFRRGKWKGFAVLIALAC